MPTPPSTRSRRCPDRPIPGPTPDQPSLRSGPPYHMTDMIAAEPAIARRILTSHLVAGGPAAALADAVRAAAIAGAPIVVTGCGTSEHAALGVAEILRDAARAAGLRRAGRSRGPGVRTVPRPAVVRAGHRRVARGRDGRDERGARSRAGCRGSNGAPDGQFDGRPARRRGGPGARRGDRRAGPELVSHGGLHQPDAGGCRRRCAPVRAIAGHRERRGTACRGNP